MTSKDKSQVEGRIDKSWLDPSSLTEFGFLPARNVIVHLLHSAVSTIQYQIMQDGTNSSEKIWTLQVLFDILVQ